VRGAATSTTRFGAALLAVVCLLAGAAPASAQKDSVVTVGGAFSVYRSTDEHVSSPWGVGIVMRLRRSSGFGGTIGFNWIRVSVDGQVAGQDSTLGTLLVRPLMAGVTYTRQYARFAVGGSLVAGYAFCGLRETGGAANALAGIGQPGAIFAVSNAFVYRPSFSVWWELGNRFGLLTSVSYMATRPEITTTTPAGTSRRTVNFSAPFVTVGIGYGIF
jgi:hypothetical protein